MAWTDGTEEITNHADLIDSREVIARIEYLQSLADACTADPAVGCDDAECPRCMEDEQHELETLVALRDEASGYAPDWQYGETLIRDSHFQAFAQELAEDCGMIPANATWPAYCIDWEWAARELQMDYTSVDFDGVTYWIR